MPFLKGYNKSTLRLRRLTDTIKTMMPILMLSAVSRKFKKCNEKLPV